MGVGAGGTPHWDGQTNGRLGEAGGYSTVCSELEGREMREVGAWPAQLQNQVQGQRGAGRGGLSFQTVPHGLEKNGLASVCCIAQGTARGRGRGLARSGQRRNDFGVRVGRAAQKGDVGVRCYCFLLGQRVGERAGRC